MTEEAIERLLRELRDGQRDILAELRDQRAHRPRALSTDDRDSLAILLPAIVGYLGSAVFTVRELQTSDNRALREIAARSSMENARKLGRLLRRACGHDVSGYLVERAGDENVALWRVVAVPK